MKKLPAETIYYIRTAVWEFNSGLIFISVWALMYQTMHLSLVQISLIYIVITISNLVLEIPTGVLADMVSRRLSVILGGIFIGSAFVLLGAFPLFPVALLTGFIEAIGDTCVSGALEAWITDEVGVERVGKVLLRGGQAGKPAHWIGVIFSITLAALWNYQTPIILGGALWYVLTIFLVLFMPEENFHRNGRNPFKNMRLSEQIRTSTTVLADGARHVRSSRTLQALFIVILLVSAFGDSFYKFSRAHILQDFILPEIHLPLLGALKDNFWLGLLEMLQGLFCLAGLEVVRQKIHLERPGASARTLLALYGMAAIALLGFTLANHFGFAMAAWVIVSGLQDIGEPVHITWLNQHVPSQVRATVISMSSQTSMIGVLGISTGLGAFGDRYGVRSALALSGLILLPIMVIYLRNTREVQKDT